MDDAIRAALGRTHDQPYGADDSAIRGNRLYSYFVQDGYLVWQDEATEVIERETIDGMAVQVLPGP